MKIKEEINFNGQTFILIWNESKDLSKLNPVKQVYAICFNSDGKILIVDAGGRWQLPGGTPEKDENIEQTLRREVDEEADIEVDKLIPVGYQSSENKQTGEIIYQLRYFARITKIKKQTIDPAINKIPNRKFIFPDEFSKYCNWGKIGEEIMRLSKKIFEETK